MKLQRGIKLANNSDFKVAMGGNLTTPLDDNAKKAQKIREYRRNVSNLAAKANKRLARIEKNNLESTPAYQSFLNNGGERFSIKGKTYNEVQQELSRINKFLNSETSTIRGIRNNLKSIAETTGIKYSNFKELQQKASKFFELAQKAEEYLRHVKDMGSAIGYQQIWQQISEYTAIEGQGLDSAEMDVDDMVRAITDALTEYETPIENTGGITYSLWKD